MNESMACLIVFSVIINGRGVVFWILPVCLHRIKLLKIKTFKLNLCFFFFPSNCIVSTKLLLLFLSLFGYFSFDFLFVSFEWLLSFFNYYLFLSHVHSLFSGKIKKFSWENETVTTRVMQSLNLRVFEFN